MDSSNYKIVAQTSDEVLSAAGSPSLTMWPYLLASAQTQKLNSISIYTDKGTSRRQARLFYMNDAAFRMWEQMGMDPRVIGETHRPPRSAALSFGMPFSE